MVKYLVTNIFIITKKVSHQDCVQIFRGFVEIFNWMLVKVPFLVRELKLESAVCHFCHCYAFKQ